MSPGSRNREILELLTRQGSLTVEEACVMFGISPATARRAFSKLVEEGQALKTWGGLRTLKPAAEGAKSGDSPLSPTRLRMERNLAAKQQIARAATQLVADGDIIFIDGGSTTFQLAAQLAERRVRIVTNSLLIAHEIDRLRTGPEGAEVFLTGGFLYPATGLALGPEAVAAVRRYQADLAFLSTGGIMPQGAFNNHHLVVEVERAMLANAQRVYLLADSTKFGHREMVHECNWQEITGIVTELPPHEGFPDAPIL